MRNWNKQSWSIMNQIGLCGDKRWKWAKFLISKERNLENGFCYKSKTPKMILKISLNLTHLHKAPFKSIKSL